MVYRSATEKDPSLSLQVLLLVLFGTIANSPAGRGNLVKTLNIHCYVPQIFASTFTRVLEALFPFLPRLSTFAHTSLTALPTSATIPILPESVSQLRLEGISYTQLFEILCRSNTSLHSLWLRVPRIDPSSDQTVTLPSLRSLVLEPDIDRDDDDVEHELNFVTRHWCLPCLSGCTFSRQVTGSRSERKLSNAVVLFLSKHGKNLKFLHLHPSLYENYPEYFLPSLRQLPQHCPYLEHLIIPPCVFTDPELRPPIFVHPTLKWIDFWQNPEGERGRSSKYWLSRTPVSCDDLPELEGARMLSELPRSLFEWLETFPPDAVKKADRTFAIDSFQNQLVHGVGHVTWRRPDWTNYEMDVDSDSASDSEVSSNNDHTSLTVWDKIGWVEYDTESSDGSYRYETESESTDQLSSDVEFDGPISADDDAEMDMLDMPLPL
ncbi:unnamed protein product [Cyclocybe aegerita]|uniref:Uncharacterized protein n=1 Tax=Cyclocybe aegerita TaxID=1973307 RepID=A0A8S0WNS4_CYCAE|nr:unnamed protein product [Cyclocybe aegerita]